MRERIISAILAIPLGLYLLHAGGVPLTLVALGVAGAGLHEFSRLLKEAGLSPQYWTALAGAATYILLAHFGLEVRSFLAVGAVLILSVTLHLFVRGINGALLEPAAAVFSSIYIGFPMASILLLRKIPESGFFWVLFLFIVVWATDIGAYFGGMLLGRHKLCPVISPNKTVEGALCGLILGGIAACGLNRLGGALQMAPHIPPWGMLGAGLIVSTSAQVGDLAESAMKRQAGVKDSGKFLPGHGGVLDRFDSLFFAAPMTYLLVSLFFRG